MGESTKSRYDMIPVIDLLATLLLDLKFSDRILVGGKGPYKGCFSPMVDMRNYDYAHLTDKIVNL